MDIRTEYFENGTPVFTSGEFPITTDSLLLADFCPMHPRHSACDLGTGSGPILLRLIDRGLRGRAVGVDVRTQGIQLLQRSIKLAGLENVQAVHGDVRKFSSGHSFDLVVSNPPYFSEGMHSPNAGRATARHDDSMNLADVCAAAKRLLKTGGSLCVCLPAVRLAAFFEAACANGLAPKRMQLVRKSTQKPPWLALIDARRMGGEGLHILPDIILPPGDAVHY